MNIVFERTHYKDSKFYDYFGRVGEFEFLINIEDCGDTCKVEQRSYLGDCSNEIYRNKYDMKETIQDMESHEYSMIKGLIYNSIINTQSHLFTLSESLHNDYVLEFKNSKDND